jgi:uncharacterized protein (TIGR03066 family)
MRKVSFVLLSGLLIVLTACSGSKSTTGAASKDKPTQASAPPPPKNSELIVGKWEGADEKDKEKGTLEFTKDGAMIAVMSAGGKEMKMNGKYKFTADDTMEVQLEVPELKKELPKETLKVKVMGDGMETTDSKGKVDKFKRVK